MKPKIVLIASLWIRDKDVASYETYERKASAILKKHGGIIEKAIRISAVHENVDVPFEIHFLSFQSQVNLNAYRSDPDLKSLSSERDRIITKTVVLEGYDATEYLRHAAT